MAVESLGALNRGYARNVFPKDDEVVWVSSTYNPNRPQTSAAKVPVPRYNLVYPMPDRLSNVPVEWRLHTNPPIYSYSRQSEEKSFYPSTPATRCQEWSTLRELFPSKGRHTKEPSYRWGTGPTFFRPIPTTREKKQGSEFSHINSPMTR